MNLFATVLTYPAPSANYRGESELNRSVIQKVTDGRFDYPIFSPESMRNAFREILCGPNSKYKLPGNRERLPDEDQLAVKFRDYPDPDQYADDFLFGYLVAASGNDRKKIRKELDEVRGKERAASFLFKRDSILRMNLAKALEPYRHNAVFTQSPLAAEGSAYKNATTSALLHRETAVTAFQYPFALNIRDCKKNATTADWTRKLLKAVGELNEVAGNHARSYFEMAPASIIVRLTPSLVAGFNTYCFKPATDKNPTPDVIDDIIKGDCGYPGKEFFIGGEIVKRGLPAEKLDALRKAGVTLDNCPRALLDIVADKALGG
jgi:CRISPR-associated protein Cst2